MPPRKILYVHPSNELYGGDRMLLWILKLLPRDTYAPHVVVPNDLPYEGLLTRELHAIDVPYQELKLGVLRRRYQSVPGMALFTWRTLASAWQMARFCRANQVALVHSNSTAVVAGALAARLAGIPHVWHVREIITTPERLHRGMAQLLWRLSSRVLTVSSPVREHLLAAQPELAYKTRVVYDGLDPSPFIRVDPDAVAQQRRAWGLGPKDSADGGLLIGMVGRISSWKGQELLVRAAAPVLVNHPQAHLALVGGNVPGEEWREEALRDLIRELGIAERVHLEGFRTDVPVVMGSFDVFCLPSTRPDPFPGVVLEAMAAGLPVVATAHGGPLEQVVEGETGYLVSPDGPEQMSQALERLAQDGALRRTLGTAGRMRMLARFSTARYVEEVVAVYETLLAESARRRSRRIWPWHARKADSATHRVRKT